jgi:hypothetical protein
MPTVEPRGGGYRLSPERDRGTNLMDRTTERRHDRIRDQLRSGASLEQIEVELENAGDLGEEQRSALWLYAWSLTAEGSRDPSRRRRHLHPPIPA